MLAPAWNRWAATCNRKRKKLIANILSKISHCIMPALLPLKQCTITPSWPRSDKSARRPIINSFGHSLPPRSGCRVKAPPCEELLCWLNNELDIELLQPTASTTHFCSFVETRWAHYLLPSVQIQAKQKRKITFSFRQIYFCDNDDFHVFQCHVIVIVQKQTHILQIFKERCWSWNVDHGTKYSKRKSSKGVNNFNDKSIQILQMTAFNWDENLKRTESGGGSA